MWSPWTKLQQILTDTKHPALTQSIANNPAPESIAQIDEFVGQLHEALTKHVFSSKKASTASIRCPDHFDRFSHSPNMDVYVFLDSLGKLK